MPSTDLHDAHHPTTDRPAPRGRRRIHLAGALAAAALACTLAACGSSGPDSIDGLAASAAAGADIPAILEEAEASMTAEVPSMEEARRAYDEWLARKAGTAEAPRPAEPLAVGDCTDHLPLGDEDTAAEIASVDCAGEHVTEVYAAVPLDELGPGFPRWADLIASAREQCGAAFPGYVGEQWVDSGNTFEFVTPDETSWREGDTTALCYAYPVTLDPFTGSLQGSGS
jgi:hypothetical protein